MEIRKILVVGATSAIAEATCRIFAKDGDIFYLVGLKEDRLVSIARDLEIRGAKKAYHQVLDMTNINQHQELLQRANMSMDGVDMLFIAYGTLPDQSLCEESNIFADQEFNTNCTSVVSILGVVANKFQEQKSGHIVAITSVAGDRGRKSNYLYGASKGAVSLFLQGLRNRLHNDGVYVLTVKPGFVDTPMTKDFTKGILWSKPELVSKEIYKAIINKNDILYTPKYWRLIMFIIKIIPESLFKRLSL
jgi:short-subunit dehydrogenase